MLNPRTVPGMKIIFWDEEQYFLKLANLWANLISHHPPELPSIKIHGFERAGLNLSVVRSLVLREKEDNISKFPDEVKLYSLRESFSEERSVLVQKPLLQHCREILMQLHLKALLLKLLKLLEAVKQ